MLLNNRVVIPTIVFEAIYVLIVLIYFIFADHVQHEAMSVFVGLEILFIIPLFLISLTVFIMFLRDDVYLFLDFAVLILLFLFDIYDFISTVVDRDNLDPFHDVIIRLSRVLRVIMFYYRMKSMLWKFKRLVQQYKLAKYSRRQFFETKTPIQIVRHLIRYNGQTNEYYRVTFDKLLALMKRQKHERTRVSLQQSLWDNNQTTAVGGDQKQKEY